MRAASVSFLFAALIGIASADQRVYVLFAHGQKGPALAAAVAAGGRVHHEFDDLIAFAVTLPDAAVAAISRNPNVVLVEEDPLRYLLSQVTPYGIDMVQAPLAVGAGATGAGIKIGVIDTGVYAAHEDLVAGNITGDPDYGSSDERSWYRDIYSHGTHVTGTLAAADNSLGVIGVSPGSVSIHMVKVFGDAGQWIYSSDLLSAVRLAVTRGSKVINMSLGGSRSSGVEKRGFDDLYKNKGILLVAAAGNDGTTAFSYPASYNSVISVAALDVAKAVADFSQKNSQVELAAPGVDVLSTVSYIEDVGVTAGGSTYQANSIEFAARGEVTAALVYGGLGDTVNAAWAGKVVLVDRGTISFNDKVQNIQASGGAAAIIANNVSGNFYGTLGDGNSSTIPAVSVSLEDGTSLKGVTGTSVTVTNLLDQPANGYALFNGTSMATPHVAGVAALIWSKYPGATNKQVRQALDDTAEDLGAVGRDTSYGYGLVQAPAALDRLATLAGGGGGGGGDTTPPVISNVSSSITNSRNGSFQITWTTNEPATSDVTINGVLYANSTLVTSHTRSFKGTKGATYIYYVSSTDAAGNTATDGPHTHNN
ncbi:MAG: hypothetical protein A3G75_00745 [Verrucomicrobia bacterium RIFCSPLOWO2_12_FULL_64_8]|nr:MAG: hypothetical protein A3G75_00745 [Verrucomicrobia bacterium RIFCSPLOWO2_12_FULL_64_8]